MRRTVPLRPARRARDQPPGPAAESRNQGLISGRHLGAREITHAPYPRNPVLTD